MVLKNGGGIEPDQVETVRRYRILAEGGNNMAMCELGDCCFFGEGTEQDFDEAVAWYRKAVPCVEEAARQLGFCCLHGEGVPQDDIEAFKWLQHTAVHGDESAQKAFKKINVAYRFGYNKGNIAADPSYPQFHKTMEIIRSKK